MLDKLKSIFGRKGLTGGVTQDARRVSVPMSGGFLGWALAHGAGLSGYAHLPASQAMEFYRRGTSVATAVDIIADEIEHIAPVLRDVDGKLLSNHDLVRRLMSPNDHQGWSELIGDAARHYLLTRDCHWYAGGTVNRPPVEIYAVKPQCVSVMEDGRDSFPGAYIVSQGPGQGQYTRAEGGRAFGLRYYDGRLREVLHVRGFSSRHSYLQGDSPLLAAALDVWQQIQGRVHNVALLENGGRPSLLIIFKDTTDADQHRMRTEMIREQVQGAGNAGRIISVSSSDMEAQEMGTSNKDMDYAKLDANATQSIYLRYKIPLPLVSNDAATYNNMESAVYHLYDRTVLPLFDRLCSGLGRMLLPRYGLDPSRVHLTYNPEQITALATRRLDELKKRKDLGLETINELRSSLPNREPLEGGDMLYQPATLIPVGQDLFTEDNATTPEERARALARRDGVEA